MGTQNLNNFYFNKLDAKINYSSYYDLFLASDEKDFNEQVVYSTNIIDYNDGDKLPVWIDLNSTESSDQPLTDCSYQYPTGTTATYYADDGFRPFVILSKNQWSQAKSQCDCPVGVSNFRICDGAWTNTDNGLNNVSDVDDSCITLYDNLPPANTFDIFAYDKRFKMHQVKAFGLVPFQWGGNTWFTDTTILNKSDSSGYYQELCGGFYQGFYKLYGYPYEVLPTRPNKGWSFESYLKLKTIGDTLVGPISNQQQSGGVYGNCYNTSGFNLFGPYVYSRSGATCCSPIVAGWPRYQLNYSSRGLGFITPGKTDKYGYFFYKGVRAEDKYFHGVDTPPLTGCTTLTGQTDCCDKIAEPVKVTGQNKSPNAEYDVYSNAIGFRITDDMRIGYKTIRYTGSCITTGETCNTGVTFDCGYTIEESYSDPICAYITKSGTCADTWIQVDVVFNRNLYLEDCEIFNNGGINDLVKVRIDKFQRYGTHKNSSSGPFGCHPTHSPETKPCKDEYPRFIEDAYFNWDCHGAQVQSWFDEGEYRMGTLTFYVNGRRVHVVENYEEIIPRQLNTNKQTQVGVAYNMSWGGGALGLREVLYPNSCDVQNSSTSWQNQSQQPDQTLIMNNFAGSFIGGISQMMYYIKPLTPDEIYHNFLINRDRYSLVDCEECKNCDDGCIDCELPTPPYQPPLEPPTPEPLSCPVTDITTSSTCNNKSYAGVFDIDPVTYDFYINPLTLYTGENNGPVNFWQNAPFGNWFFEFTNDDLLQGQDLQDACYDENGSKYCTGIENGGTHWMWYPTVITVSYNGTFQSFSEDNTWTDIINYLDLQGAPVDNTMTLEEVNSLNPDDLTVVLSGMEPCLCD